MRMCVGQCVVCVRVCVVRFYVANNAKYAQHFVSFTFRCRFGLVFVACNGNVP